MTCCCSHSTADDTAVMMLSEGSGSDMSSSMREVVSLLAVNDGSS